MQVNDIVIFSPRAGESAEGIVTRVWDKPASDPYVTVRTTEDAGRTFVRPQSAVRPDHDSTVIRAGRCAEHGGMDFAACPPAGA